MIEGEEFFTGPKDTTPVDGDEGVDESEREHGLAEEGWGGMDHKPDERTND